MYGNIYYNMTTIRKFTLFDMLQFNNINLDPMT